MADIPGKDVLLYIGDGGGPEVFSLIAAGTSHSMTVNSTTVVKNSKDSGGWSEIFPDGAIRSVSLSMSGIFKETADQDALRTLSMADPPSANFRFTLGGTRRITGNFQVTSYEHSGETEGFASFTASFESNGVITEEANS
jgi:TP901-1 family phage major tail protein